MSGAPIGLPSWRGAPFRSHLWPATGKDFDLPIDVTTKWGEPFIVVIYGDDAPYFFRQIPPGVVPTFITWGNIDGDWMAVVEGVDYR